MRALFLPSVVLLFGLSSSAMAHELAANRATLVLRDSQHLALTLLVDYPVVLHKLMAPQRSFQEFALIASSMKPQEFKTQLQDAQRKLQAATAVVGRSSKAVVLTRWAWPDAAVVQGLMQQRAMQAVVGSNEHTHAVLSEIKTETSASNSTELTAVSLQLPTELDQVLVVSYQPKQAWFKPGKTVPVIKF